MKTAVFWIVAPYSLVEVHGGFRGACCLHHQDDEKPRRQPLQYSDLANSVFLHLIMRPGPQM
jgi:hypothetical protein